MSDDPVDTYEVRHAGAERKLREIGNIMKREMPSGYGFALFIFEYDASKQAPGNMFYLSSGRREDMLKALKEFIAKQEQQSGI